MGKFRRLAEKDRVKIELLLSLNQGVRSIARKLQVSPSTISREINKAKGAYKATEAEWFSRKRSSKRRGSKFKIQGDLELQVRKKLLLDWSPEQIVGALMKKRKGQISVASIYRFIERDHSQGGELKSHLRILRKQRKDRKSPKWRKYQGSLSNRVPISDRPRIVDRRTRLGDIERDTVFGVKNGTLILTMVDRRSRYTRLELLKEKCSELVHEATVRALKNQVVKTITNDNGTEFARHRETSRALKAPVYFSKAYAAWERGTNENTNGLLRQYLPRRKDIGNLSRKQIRYLENKLNHRPRKCLHFKTPYEVQKQLSSTAKVLR